MPNCPKCKIPLSVIPYGCLCPICERFFYGGEVRRMKGFSEEFLDFEMVRFSVVFSWVINHLGLETQVIEAIEREMERFGGLS